MKSLEIFSGAGGLAKGLELAGFEHASFVEFNKHACASLRKNFDPHIVFQGDIADYDLIEKKFLDAAQASCASAIITGDEDLLVLKMIGATPIMTVKEFLELENV